MAATAVALTPTVPASLLAWLAYRDDRREAADPAAKTAILAAAVAATETRQRAQLIGEGAHRIDLTYRYRPESANNATGAAVSGRLSDITAYYRGVRPARLVVTGAPGAGKTVLASDLVLGLLTDPARTDTDPVPVRISLAGWETERPLVEWLTDQVHQRFRDQGLTAADAETLVEQRRILPVLDGLDEMDNDTTPVPRRRAVVALRQLNAYQDPAGSASVILTCRTDQYSELAALDMRMREAARIEIEPVTPAQADAYLTARSTDPTRWTPVVTTLHTAPGGTLARSLDTPWRLNLAATVYEERDPDTLLPVRDPGDLCALASPGTVRDHLLGLYVPAVVRQHPTRPGRYRPDDTHRRLGAFLHWSYGAGLLRISGIAYQFRHRELQNWLASRPNP
ncbi:NACHT domain-containing protein [Embleya sp. NPDC005971]|uniref:NACHT domain-containing protein n=1 Tax=Embleya sp. NPDC005971 TaxID=3156724 RepID=UPI0033C8D347